MRKPVRTSLFWVNFFTGTTDGLVLPVVACMFVFAFSPARLEYIVYAGILVSVSGALVFGLARYFGELSEIQHHHPQLSLEEAGKEQVLMRHIGIDADLSRNMETQMDSEKQTWLDEVRENNLDWEQLDKTRAGYSAVQTGIGFLCAGGLSQLSVYLYLKTHLSHALPARSDLFPYFIFPLSVLFIIGGWKAVYTGRKFMRGGLFTFAYGFFTFTLAIFLVWLLLQRE